MDEAPPVGVAILTELFQKYRYALLVLAVGLILLMFPMGEHSQAEEATPTVQTNASQELDDSSELEQRLAKSLSAIKGVGHAEVILTVEASSRRIFAQDVDKNGESQRNTTIVLSGSDRTEEVIATQVISPVYQGALVVCQGGNDPAVCLEVLHAVQALTGLRADRIAISQYEANSSQEG